MSSFFGSAPVRLLGAVAALAFLAWPILVRTVSPARLTIFVQFDPDTPGLPAHRDMLGSILAAPLAGVYGAALLLWLVGVTGEVLLAVGMLSLFANIALIKAGWVPRILWPRWVRRLPGSPRTVTEVLEAVAAMHEDGA